MLLLHLTFLRGCDGCGIGHLLVIGVHLGVVCGRVGGSLALRLGAHIGDAGSGHCRDSAYDNRGFLNAREAGFGEVASPQELIEVFHRAFHSNR